MNLVFLTVAHKTNHGVSDHHCWVGLGVESDEQWVFEVDHILFGLSLMGASNKGRFRSLLWTEVDDICFL